MVIQGGGEILVTGVGESSCNGKLAAALQVEKSETPLQEKLGVCSSCFLVSKRIELLDSLEFFDGVHLKIWVLGQADDDR